MGQNARYTFSINLKSYVLVSYLQFLEVEVEYMAVTDFMALLKITVSDSESSAALDEPNLNSILLGKHSVILSFVINDQPIRELKFNQTEIS